MTEAQHGGGFTEYTTEHTYLNTQTYNGCAPDESGLNAPTKAKHFSSGKSGVDQIPPEVLMLWGDIFRHGEEKYGRNNWKSGTEWHEFYGSALRHLYKWWLGEDIDPDSGEPHLAHSLWNVGALIYFQLHGLGNDDRPQPYSVRRVTEVQE